MAEIVSFPSIESGTPDNEKRKVPVRRRNSEYRSREHLTEDEVNAMVRAVSGRNVQRDRLLILLAYRHGLRVSELTDIRWSDVDFQNARLYVRRLKNSLPTTQPLQGDVLRLLRAVERLSDGLEWVFLSERGAPMTASSVRYVVRKAGDAAGLRNVHPHQLRHGCGYHLANRGVDTRAIQEYLGHKSITHTTRYTTLSAERFKGMWDR